MSNIPTYRTKLEVEELKRTDYNQWLMLSTQAKKCHQIISNFKEPFTSYYAPQLAPAILLPQVVPTEENLKDPNNYFSFCDPERSPGTPKYHSRMMRLRACGVLLWTRDNGRKVYEVNPAWLDTYSEPVTIRPADPVPEPPATPAEPIVSAQPAPTQPTEPPLHDLIKEMASLPIAEVKLVAGEQEARLCNVNLEAVYRVAKVYKETFGAPTPKLEEPTSLTEPVSPEQPYEVVEDETDAPF